MSDIKRNAGAKLDVPSESIKETKETVQTNRTTKKEVEYSEVKEKGKKVFEITIDNFMRTQMQMLYAINTNLVTIVKQLKEIKDKK